MHAGPRTTMHALATDRKFSAAARHVGASLEYMADSPILRDHVTKT